MSVLVYTESDNGNFKKNDFSPASLLGTCSEAAFAEILRVLKPGGHFCISDVVSSQALPEWLKGIAEAYAGCVAGAIPKQDYLELIQQTGFKFTILG